MTGRPPLPNEVRFWRFVQKTETCWLWTGSLVQGSGYGQFSKRLDVNTYDNRAAHIFSYELHFGPVPPGKQVCHSCDVRHCVRPDHLWAGTQKENLDDMRSKGRENFLSGPNNPMWGKSGELNPMWGRQHSTETRRLIGVSQASSRATCLSCGMVTNPGNIARWHSNCGATP